MTELGVLLGLVEKFGQQWGWLVALVAVGAWLIRCRWVERTPAEAQARKSDAEAGAVKADAYHRGMEASGGLIDKLMERNDRLVKRIEVLEQRLDDLEEESGQEMATLRAQVAQLQTENEHLQAALETEQADKAQLLRENEELRKRVAELERIVGVLEERCEQEPSS